MHETIRSVLYKQPGLHDGSASWGPGRLHCL